ncbi:unnamed protein product [Cylicostephanus goldi]|uniref:Peptidase M1 membrane alanine aminopeptidase domain-containing protein n=1 Tax=Cylicostephanus goldi TaxID=71465 RepID=A0A3P6QRA8_CYLGO|nr:unnamed protein product [Cylicostephanus goldi]
MTNLMTCFDSKVSDLVALPDFAAGAMENWGLVTENSLLYEKKVYAPENKRRIVQIVAHELGHQVSTETFLIEVGFGSTHRILRLHLRKLEYIR